MIRARWEGQSEAWRLGAASTAALGVLLVAWALSVDLPRATTGFFSDGATYYSLGHSLAEDGDFEYRREDLVRVWREFPSGPEGIFLKRGRSVQLSMDARPPFVHATTGDDPDPGRLYYGKSFIFPLAAAPFIAVAGTHGFLLLHALLLTAAFLCAYAFLAARSHPAAALTFAAAFVLVSAAPVYMVWLTPDFFNFGVVTLGYFFWLYKEVASPSRPDGGARSRWLTGRRADLVAAVLLGAATFSKPTHVLLMLPPLALWAWRRRWRHVFGVGLVYAAVVLALFGTNIAITGEWNYQGGDRRTFYSGQGGFPFQTERNGFDAVGLGRTTNRVPVEVLSSRDAVVDVFLRNLIYFSVGRHTGFAVYYLPGVAAMLLFFVARAPRAAWQWMTLAGGVGSAVALLLYMPFTYSGGGGPVGNRYFLGVYPVFLFLAPAMARPWAGVATMAASALFVAPILSNPFVSSFRPGEHTKSGLFRVLPLELSLVNDLPVNVSPSRSRQPLGGTPPVSAYFMDDNAYAREGEAFWVRGESRSDIMLRAPSVTGAGPHGETARPLAITAMRFQLESGPKPTRVHIRTGAASQTIDVPANDARDVTLPMGRGLPYKPFPELPTNYVYALSVEADAGFIPLFEVGGRDNRFLGIFVRMTPQYDQAVSVPSGPQTPPETLSSPAQGQ